MRAQRKVFVVLLTLLMTAVAVATPLDDYIAKPDPSYTYSVVQTIDNPLGKVYIIDMKSQTWRTEKEVNRTLWQHWLTIIVPNDVTSNTALLFINGGSNKNTKPPSPDLMLAQIAVQSKTVLVDLKQVPNEPLIFADDPGNERSEDAIIAYTFDKFLKTQDPTWPLLLPMVKSAVRAMDTVQDHINKVDRRQGPDQGLRRRRRLETRLDHLADRRRRQARPGHRPHRHRRAQHGPADAAPFRRLRLLLPGHRRL